MNMKSQILGAAAASLLVPFVACAQTADDKPDPAYEQKCVAKVAKSLGYDAGFSPDNSTPDEHQGTFIGKRIVGDTAFDLFYDITEFNDVAGMEMRLVGKQNDKVLDEITNGEDPGGGGGAEEDVPLMRDIHDELDRVLSAVRQSCSLKM